MYNYLHLAFMSYNNGLPYSLQKLNTTFSIHITTEDTPMDKTLLVIGMAASWTRTYNKNKIHLASLRHSNTGQQLTGLALGMLNKWRHYSAISQFNIQQNNCKITLLLLRVMIFKNHDVIGHKKFPSQQRTRTFCRSQGTTNIMVMIWWLVKPVMNINSGWMWWRGWVWSNQLTNVM